MENINVLNGKYGEEGDKLIFRILDSGDFIKDVDSIESKDSNNLRKEISKKGLRYDLTVPFARYVSMNRDKITLPFKKDIKFKMFGEQTDLKKEDSESFISVTSII